MIRMRIVHSLIFLKFDVMIFFFTFFALFDNINFVNAEDN